MARYTDKYQVRTKASRLVLSCYTLDEALAKANQGRSAKDIFIWFELRSYGLGGPANNFPGRYVEIVQHAPR